jgi:hypothetical protein
MRGKLRGAEIVKKPQAFSRCGSTGVQNSMVLKSSIRPSPVMED